MSGPVKPYLEGSPMSDAAAEPQLHTVDIEADLNAAIEACGGDIRAALRATLIANAFLDAEVERLSGAASAGFARGRIRRRPEAKTAG
jgi:hypothetical protein